MDLLKVYFLNIEYWLDCNDYSKALKEIKKLTEWVKGLAND